MAAQHSPSRTHPEPTRIACFLTLVSSKPKLLPHSYIASSSEAKHAIKRKWRARLLKYAKNLIRLQTNVKEKTFKKDEVIYREGDQGKSMVSRKDSQASFGPCPCT